MLGELVAYQTGAQVTVPDSAQGFEVPRDEKVVRVAAAAIEQDADRKVQWTGMRSWTDAANLVAKGIPSVVLGGGELAVAHSEGEAVNLTEL